MKATIMGSNRRFLVYFPFLFLPFLALTFQYFFTNRRATLSGSSSVEKNQISRAQQDRNNKTISNLLMAQYSGGDSYSALLDLTRPINQAYAKMWGFDFLLISGYLIQAELEKDQLHHTTSESNRNATTDAIPESRATYNKVMLLELVLTNENFKHYDKLLILDSDAVMYDFSRDIETLLPVGKMLVAHKVDKQDTSNSTFNINIGVTLWNLRHAATLHLVRNWKAACLDRILNQPGLRDSDQNPLQRILKSLPEKKREQLVLAVPDELGYGSGQFVRHFIRFDAENWTVSGMDTRAARIQQAVNEVCERTFTARSHPTACSELFRNQG
jgi:hypothetical protein